jgi:hypothetical protein
MTIINTPDGPVVEPATPVTPVVELTATLPDRADLRIVTLAAITVLGAGAELLQSTAEPWQLKARQGTLGVAPWRARLINLVELLLPGEAAPSLPADHLDTIANLAERCANLHAATSLPLRPELHLEAIAPALQEMAAQLRAIYVEVSGEDPWEDEPTPQR